MFVKLLALIFLACLAVSANLSLGDVVLAPICALATLFKENSALASPEYAEMLWQIRLPRLIAAFLVGAALAVSGYLLQALSRNDLADPYLTGVSSGAALGAAGAILMHADLSLIPIFAFVGGLGASFLVAQLARLKTESGYYGGISVPRLLLAGIALSAIVTAVIQLAMNAFGTQLMAQGLNLWVLGGLSGRTWPEITPASIYIAIGLGLALLAAKPLRLLSLGEEAAASLGLNVPLSQLFILAAAVLLSSCAVALSGLIGFVGLVAPHLTRRLFPRGERIQIISCALVGAIITLVADLFARVLMPSQELPLGALMAVAGGPFFIALLSRSIDRLETT
ncbi:MAG: iron ABC transporter permease [Cyanobacteria bacterium SZAS LIN-3]|nr:iron ABC transporter permease [Cyanobacteria bacterium SZAS LIN-3]